MTTKRVYAAPGGSFNRIHGINYVAAYGSYVDAPLDHAQMLIASGWTDSQKWVGDNNNLMRDNFGNFKGIAVPGAPDTPVYSSRLLMHNIAAHVPLYENQGANERGSTATYHTTIEIADSDALYVRPIIFVTRDPSDPTYTSDDTYNSIAVAPTASLLDANGQPNPTGGNSAWNVATNVAFPRQTGASTSAPIPVPSPTIIPLANGTLPRTDGGDGRLLMMRAYSNGASFPGTGATSRMPVYNALNPDQALWDSAFPKVGLHKLYYHSGADYASTNQDQFSTTGTPATRTANQVIVGAELLYKKPHFNILIVGDSIPSGAYAESGVPTYMGMVTRAVELLRNQGYSVDLTNLGMSGQPWDDFMLVLNSFIGKIKFDLVMCITYSPNGTNHGGSLGRGNTLSDAILHWGKFLTVRDNVIASGCKAFAAFTPPPAGAQGSPANPVPRLLLRNWLMGSGIPYYDMMNLAMPDYSYQSQYTVDPTFTHPNALGNIKGAPDVATLFRQLLPL